MADVNKDAAFIQAVRKALDTGASVTTVRGTTPAGAKLTIILDGLSPEQRKAIELAFFVAYYD